MWNLTTEELAIRAVVLALVCLLLWMLVRWLEKKI